jgi:hypothetical protein
MRSLGNVLLAAAAMLLGCGGDGGNGGGGDGPLRFESEAALGRGGVLPEVAATAEGNLHLVYRGELLRGDNGVYYQFYRASDRRWSTAVRIDDGGHLLARTLEFGSPVVAAAPDGRATVVWGGHPDEGNSVWARDIGADGTPAGLFVTAHQERGIAVEQHDLAIDSSGTAHLVFSLIGSGQDGVYHKSRPAGGLWAPGARRRIYHLGRKHPAVEARRGGSGPLLWAAWRFHDMEFISFDGTSWSAPQTIAAPGSRSFGDPALAIDPAGRPAAASSPFQRGVSNRTAVLVRPDGAPPVLEVDAVSISSSGTVDIGFADSGVGIIVWDRFVLGARPDLSMISQLSSLDSTKDKVLNRRRLCYKLSGPDGRFPAIPDQDNSNAFVLPFDEAAIGEQSYPTLDVRGDTLDLVYLETRGAASELRHRRIRFKG